MTKRLQQNNYQEWELQRHHHLLMAVTVRAMIVTAVAHPAERGMEKVEVDGSGSGRRDDRRPGRIHDQRQDTPLNTH